MRAGRGGGLRKVDQKYRLQVRHPIYTLSNKIKIILTEAWLMVTQFVCKKNMFQNQAYCLQSIPSHRNQSPCHIFTTGGGSEHNEGERTLAYYPKIDDKYCFLDAMASLESMLESE